MSHVDELIVKLCPSGVPFEMLGDIATVARGASPRPIQAFITYDDDGVPWIKIGDVSAGSKYITKTAQRVTADGAAKSRRVHPGDFVLSNSMSFGRPYISQIEGCIHDGWLAISSFSNSFIPDFLYHLLRSARVQAEFARRAGGGTVQNLNADIVKSVTLPVPPIEVQREIVHILDLFTELEAKLQGELEVRRLQYGYYCDRLFTFGGADSVQRVPMGELGEIFRGKRFTKADYVSEGGVACIHYGDIYTEYGTVARRTASRVRADLAPSLRFARKGDVVLTDVGETVEDVGKAVAWLGDEEAAIHDHCYVVRSSVNPAYLSYYMQTAAYRADKDRYVARTKVKTLLLDGLKRIVVPVPSREEQERIVSILEKFDVLVNDRSIGLPAELNARRRQYEYYRDRLLIFKELAA